MPASTPIYGFTYPCPGDTISSATFTTLANQIDAKLLDLSSTATLALNRPNIELDDPGVQTVTAGVDTVLTLSDSTYVIPMAGVWVFWVEVAPASSPPTITMVRARVRQNGVVRYGMNLDTEANNTITVRTTGVLVAASGDVVSTQYLYTGSGTMDVQTKFSAKMIVQIP
jgi:hypothetical protein